MGFALRHRVFHERHASHVKVAIRLGAVRQWLCASHVFVRSRYTVIARFGETDARRGVSRNDRSRGVRVPAAALALSPSTAAAVSTPSTAAVTASTRGEDGRHGIAQEPRETGVDVLVRLWSSSDAPYVMQR